MRRVSPSLCLSLALSLAGCGAPSGATDGSSGADTTDAGATTGAPTTSGTGETGGTGGTGGASSGGVDGVPGCDGGGFLPVPEDTSLRGPWPVGARTVTVGGLTAEVWYPAAVGSEAGAEKIRYDIRGGLPDSEQAKVSDADNPWQDCDCYRDLPLDEGHGPYPAVVFVHGTAGFRSQSLEFMEHWASRGFVVIAADHPGLWLKDLLGQLCGLPAVSQDLQGDIAALVAGLQAPAGDLAFLAGHVDGGRIGMAGHSAGGAAIQKQGGVARVLMPMALGGVEAGAALESTLIFGALSDQVVAYSMQQQGYASSPAPKRLIGIENAGHLTFSSLCALKNANGQDFLEIAAANGVCGAQFAGALFDCDPAYLPAEDGWDIVRDASAAALESVLRCSDAAGNFAGLQAKYPAIAEYQEAL